MGGIVPAPAIDFTSSWSKIFFGGQWNWSHPAPALRLLKLAGVGIAPPSPS